MVKNFLLISNLNLPSFSLKLLAGQCEWEKAVSHLSKNTTVTEGENVNVALMFFKKSKKSEREAAN